MNKRLIFIAAALIAAFPAFAQVGVSVNIGEPGFFGQIDIGDAPPPQVINAEPVIVAPAPGVVVGPPVYLHVPPGYERHWAHHCAEYHACGQRVLFVRDGWYRNTYVPHYRQMHGHPGEMRRDEHREEWHDDHHEHDDHHHD